MPRKSKVTKTKKKTTKEARGGTSTMTLRKRLPKLTRTTTISDILTAPTYTRVATTWDAGTKKKKSYKAMVVEAITAVGKRGWAPHISIYKYIFTNYEVPENTYKATIKRTLVKGEEEGTFERKNGRYFKVKVKKPKKKATTRAKKTPTKKKTTRAKKTSTAKKPTRRGRPPKKAKKAPAKKVKRVPKISRGPSVISFNKNQFKDRVPKSTGTDAGITEVVFSFDCTGSMGAALEQARTCIKETSERLFKDVPNGRLKVGIIAHGDYCARTEKGCLASVDLTDDAKKIQKFLKNPRSMSGGDAPECYELVLEQVQNFDWTEGSNRILVVIGDAQPHTAAQAESQMNNFMGGNCFGKARKIDWKDEADQLYEMGVKVYGVHALNNSAAGNFYRSIAARTCGTYVTLNDFKIVNDMILAICFREVSREKFLMFEKEVMAAKRMDAHRRRLFRQVSDGLPEEDE